MSSHLSRGISPTALSSVTHIASVQFVQPSSISARGLPGLLMRSSSRQSAVGRCHFSSDGVRYAVQKGRACADDPLDAIDHSERFVQVRCCPVSSNQGNEHECILHVCWQGMDPFTGTHTGSGIRDASWYTPTAFHASIMVCFRGLRNVTK